MRVDIVWRTWRQRESPVARSATRGSRGGNIPDGRDEGRRGVEEESERGGGGRGQCGGFDGRLVAQWPGPVPSAVPPSAFLANAQLHHLDSTRLVSATVPLNIPRSLLLSLSLGLCCPPPSLFLSFFTVFRLPTLRSPPSRSDPMRAFALAPLSSPLVHPADQPVDRFSLFIVIYPISSRLSHERVATRAKRPTAFFACFSPWRQCDALLSLAPFCHSRSTASISSSLSLFLTSRSRGHAAYSLLHSSSSLSSFSSPPSFRFLHFLCISQFVQWSSRQYGWIRNYLSHTTWAVYG